MEVARDLEGRVEVPEENDLFVSGLQPFSPTKISRMSVVNTECVGNKEQAWIASSDSEDLEVELVCMRKEKLALQKEICKRELLSTIEKEKAELLKLKEHERDSSSILLKPTMCLIMKIGSVGLLIYLNYELFT